MIWVVLLHLLRPADPDSPEAAMTVEAATTETTREDNIEALGHLCATAKMLRRQGYVGIYGQSYARVHQRIDGLLSELWPDG